MNPSPSAFGPGCVIAVALGALSACAAGPDYEPPVIETGSGWTQSVARGEPELSTWWQTFDDPVLDRLVAAALEQNLDLRAAAARVAEARAARDAIAGARLPRIDAVGSVTERRQSENGPIPINEIPAIERDQTIHDLGFDASWEIDLAGRTRRGIEAADARIAAADAELAGASIRLVAEVGRTYLVLRGAQAQLAARRSSVAAARRTNELVQQRVAAGASSRAELAQSDADVAALAAGIPALEAQARAAALGLGLLLGRPPEAEIGLLETPVALAELEPLPVDERANLLRRRPDVVAAERELAAATAEIGVATAELFPRLVIGAQAGFESLETGELFDASSETWSIMPALRWRLFDGGRVHAGIRRAEARTERAATAYEGTVLAALNDAERALSRYSSDLETLVLQRTAVEAARRSESFAEQRYRAGEIALLELLDAERVRNGAEETLAATHTRAAIDLVALYKALGGGWEHDDVP
jgi:NodT family efflux transporter outer membrane factor (OMF) lipoprotein